MPSATATFAMVAAMFASSAFALTTAAASASTSGAQCIKTVPVEPELASMGPTGQCIFSAATATVTSTVDCGSCDSVKMLNLGGIGPECRGVTTAPGTMTIHTAVCSGAAAPTGTNQASTTTTTSLSINPGGPIITAPPNTTNSKPCTSFFTKTPGCNPAADNERECMTTICSTAAPTTIQTTATPHLPTCRFCLDDGTSSSQ